MIAQSWEAMIVWAARYRAILCTGPQRSGTQLAARVIENELAFRFVSYVDMRADLVGLSTLIRLVESNDSIVWHHPDAIMLTPVIAKDPRIGVVITTRSPAACIRSRDRIGYDGLHTESIMLGCIDDDLGVIRRQHEKSTVWAREYPNVCQLPYRRMSTHPLFVARDQRAGWDAHRWRP